MVFGPDILPQVGTVFNNVRAIERGQGTSMGIATTQKRESIYPYDHVNPIKIRQNRMEVWGFYRGSSGARRAAFLDSTGAIIGVQNGSNMVFTDEKGLYRLRAGLAGMEYVYFMGNKKDGDLVAQVYNGSSNPDFNVIFHIGAYNRAMIKGVWVGHYYPGQPEHKAVPAHMIGDLVVYVPYEIDVVDLALLATFPDPELDMGKDEVALRDKLTIKPGYGRSIENFTIDLGIDGNDDSVGLSLHEAREVDFAGELPRSFLALPTYGLPWPAKVNVYSLSIGEDDIYSLGKSGQIKPLNHQVKTLLKVTGAYGYMWIRYAGEMRIHQSIGADKFIGYAISQALTNGDYKKDQLVELMGNFMTANILRSK